MKVVERVRHRTPVESGRDERERLRRQVRRLTERNAIAFDQGFQACIDMVRHGADLEQLRAASGVVAADHDDTSPTELRDCGLEETSAHVVGEVFDVDTDVDIVALPE